MLSCPLRVRMRGWKLVFTMPVFALCACATHITVSRPAANCSALIPSSLAADTPGAPLPAEQTIGAWEVFGDAQTGQLDKANVDRRAALEILKKCEEHDREAEEAILKKKDRLR